jgi:hypothetical protein
MGFPINFDKISVSNYYFDFFIFFFILCGWDARAYDVGFDVIFELYSILYGL